MRLKLHALSLERQRESDPEIVQLSLSLTILQPTTYNLPVTLTLSPVEYIKATVGTIAGTTRELIRKDSPSTCEREMTYKLYYFRTRGRGEIIRFVLSAAGINYEDIRFSQEEWQQTYKAMSPTGVAPFLEDPVTGKTLVQSFAIAAMLARRHGLMSHDTYECYMIDRMMQQLKDIEDAFVPILFGPEESRPAARKGFLETKGPYHFSTLVKYLRESDSKFAVGKSLTLADLALINLMDFVQFLGPDVHKLLASYPELAEHREHVLNSNKGLADYLASREPHSF